MSFKIISRFLRNHPLTKDRLIEAYFRFAKWQLISRLNKGYMEYPFIEESKLWVKHGMTGATGNIYAGLHEFSDMSFLLHVLRKEDIFADVGANIGSYTVLASAVVGARSFSFEPIPSTFAILQKNIEINNLGTKVKAVNAGVGESEGKLSFTNLFDTVNHVVQNNETAESQIEVEVNNLDYFLGNNIPKLIKIDVEGFEKSVLLGAKTILADSNLKAIIIELNGCCHNYGVDESTIHQILLDAGFSTFEYQAFERKIMPVQSFNNEGNTLYIRDLGWANQRVKESRKYKVLGKEF